MTKCILQSKQVSENFKKGISLNGNELFFMYKNLKIVDFSCFFDFLSISNTVLNINLCRLISAYNKNLTDIFANKLIKSLEICGSVEELKLS